MRFDNTIEDSLGAWCVDIPGEKLFVVCTLPGERDADIVETQITFYMPIRINLKIGNRSVFENQIKYTHFPSAKDSIQYCHALSFR